MGPAVSMTISNKPFVRKIVNVFINSLLLLLLTCLLSLSFWQYQRSDEKRRLIEQFNSQANPIVFKELPIEPLQRYQFHGEYDSSHQLLLDNKFHQHRAGYHVITPLWLESQQAYVLVNRGWVARTSDRLQLPMISTRSGPHDIVGHAMKFKRNRFIIKHVAENPGQWPLVIEDIDFGMIAGLLEQRVLPFVVWLDPDHSDRYVRDWQVVTISPERHLAYSVQWLLLAVTLVILIIITKRNKRQ